MLFIGLTSFEKLVLAAKNHNIDLTRSEIKKIYDEQQINQIYSNKQINYLPTICPFGSGACLQIDLMDISKFFKDNKPVKY